MALNTLLSFAYHQRTDLAALRRRAPCGRLIIDSGAFTAYTLGKAVSLDAYAEYLEHWSGSWDHAVTLDVIGDADQTAVNTRRLHTRGIPVMPVFTRGGKLADFDAMVRDHGYVCVGGLVGVDRRVQGRRIEMLSRRARALGGGIHALGIGSMSTLRAARPYSADVSTFGWIGRFGGLVWYDGRTLQQAVPKPSSAAKLAKHRETIRDHGLDIGPMIVAGRMPNGAERVRALASFATAYMAADEHLTTSGAVPAPRGTDDMPGTHLYVAPGGKESVEAVVQAHDACHGDDPPRVWRRYGHAHRCRTHHHHRKETA